jgi:hypothetical protein
VPDLDQYRSRWRVWRRGEAPSEEDLRAELDRLGWDLIGQDEARGGWVARRRGSHVEAVGGWPEYVAALCARWNQRIDGARVQPHQLALL